MVFGWQRCQLIPRLWLFATSRWFEVFGVVGGCSDGMPANIAVTSFGLSIEVFWGRVIELGRGRCWDLEAFAEGDRLSAAKV